MKILQPVPKRQWRTPSQSQPKDIFGNENRVIFRLTAKLDDGHIIWRGWFDDRDDADEFLWAIATGTLVIQPQLWRLPTPHWHPDLVPYANYDFATVTFITTTGAGTFTRPFDWNDISNSIECIGGGSSGACTVNSAVFIAGAPGGAGAAYAKTVNLAIAASSNLSVGTGGAAVVRSATATVSGNVGADTWFGNAVFASANVGAKGAGAATGGTSIATFSGATGGQASASIGTTKNNGGNSGSVTLQTNNIAVTGGGGAAGLNGDGAASANVTANGTNPTSDGGPGDAGSGGTGGIAPSSSAGSPGTEWDASHGSGGGGASNGSGSGAVTSGSGGNYGAGGGGVVNATANSTTSGAGIQGLIVLTNNSIMGWRMSVNPDIIFTKPDVVGY